MNDPAEIRAEGRRLLANVVYLGRFLRDHADVLLADPAPEGLSEEERERYEQLAATAAAGNYDYLGAEAIDDLLAMVRRLSASPETGVRIRDLGRLSRGCSHGIYHHGCPSCDRQDPEERL